MKSGEVPGWDPRADQRLKGKCKNGGKRAKEKGICHQKAAGLAGLSVAESEAAAMKQAQWGWALDLVARRLMGAGPESRVWTRR